MEHINHHLSDSYTVLKDRILWFDGDSSYDSKALANKILSGSKSWYNEYVIDAEEFSVKQFNRLNENIHAQLKEKNKLNIDDSSFQWNIPEEYKKLSIKKVIYNKLLEELKRCTFSKEEEDERIERVITELKLWKESNMFDLLKTLMYIVDTFIENDIIWGTGRGSSCCSYILYLIGLHDVDSVHYDLEITDFFRA